MTRDEQIKYIAALAHFGGMLSRGDDIYYIHSLMARLTRNERIFNLSPGDLMILAEEAEKRALNGEVIEHAPWCIGGDKGPCNCGATPSIK